MGVGANGAVFDPDRDLVARACGGDRDAFERLLRQHYDRMHRVAWRLTGSGADAEDIAQDVCCALVEKIASFKGEAKFTTWLTGIVVNACRDHRRRGLTSSRMRERLSVLAGLTPDRTAAIAIGGSGWRASSGGSIRWCAPPSCWWWART
jgi:DNA-directed RNA polymerase specialized sigma24 family protein